MQEKNNEFFVEPKQSAGMSAGVVREAI